MTDIASTSYDELSSTSSPILQSRDGHEERVPRSSSGVAQIKRAELSTLSRILGPSSPSASGIGSSLYTTAAGRMVDVLEQNKRPRLAGYERTTSFLTQDVIRAASASQETRSQVDPRLFRRRPFKSGSSTFHETSDGDALLLSSLGVESSSSSNSQQLSRISEQLRRRAVEIQKQRDHVKNLQQELAGRDRAQRERERTRRQLTELEELRAKRRGHSRLDAIVAARIHRHLLMLPADRRGAGEVGSSQHPLAGPSPSSTLASSNFRFSPQSRRSSERIESAAWSGREDQDLYGRKDPSNVPRRPVDMHYQATAHRRGLVVSSSSLRPAACLEESNPRSTVASSRCIRQPHASAQEYFPRPEPGKGLTLGIPADKAILSDFQVLLRQSLEFFEVQPIDQINGIPGRKKELVVGQVGIRCRYCAHKPPHWRGRGAVYYPRSLDSVYQAAQNMGMHHFMQSCTEIPEDVKTGFEKARQKQKQEIRRSGGKSYWTETSRHMGLEDREGRNGMWFKEQHQR